MLYESRCDVARWYLGLLAIAVVSGFWAAVLPVYSASAEQPFATKTQGQPLPKDYRERRHAFLESFRRNDSSNIHAQLARLRLGLPADDRRISESLERIRARRDCADFDMAGVIRLLYQFGDSPLLSTKAINDVRQCVLEFKYWPDEPGVDSMCTWSENHHILFSSAEYLAGQLYPDSLFTNSSQTGRQKMDRGRRRVARWLDLRYRTGFSEWLSNVYYVEDMVALVNLVDFAHDAEIAQKATMVLDLMLLDMALNHFHGTFASTHGRSYFPAKADGTRESTSSIYGLQFSLNSLGDGNMAAVALALSPKYRMPAVLQEIATDTPAELENRQRAGIRVEEAARWGLDCTRLDDGMTFLSLEAYTHPRIIDLTMRMFDRYHWWQNRFFAPFQRNRRLIEAFRSLKLLPLLIWVFERDLTRNMRPEVNIYTYRTPDYMLSSAQDYRAGYGGDQQHVWSAALGSRAIVFTTHPVSNRSESPSEWVGNGTMPRVAQVKNVLIAAYNIWTWPGLYVTHSDRYTHAWFPRSEFDETRDQGGWLLGRKGNGYVALWSQEPRHWQTEGPWKDKEVIAPGRKNIWICELGSRAQDGTFPQFVEKVSHAAITTHGLHARYRSPSQGLLEFGWTGPCRHNETPVQLHDYDRYRNPYVTAAFPADGIEVRSKNHWLRLDYGTLRRAASDFLGEPGGWTSPSQ